MAIQDDFSIASNGDIRYTGTTNNYTVIQLHRWLGDLMDDAQASGNDILDITDSTASERSTDNIITLKPPYNIDEIAARHLYDGSIIQDNGDTIYDGILVFSAPGTYLSVQQNGKLVTPNFWTTGLNADAANGISHRFMLKVRTGGSDIDGRRLIGQTREFGYSFSEFRINGTARGNNVMALTYATDLNNQTASSTVAGYTSISNTEGYRTLDVDNNAISEHYYSEWNKSTYTINQFYERTKWLSQRTFIEDSNADTGTNYALDNTTTRRAQSFTVGANSLLLSRVHVNLKKVGTPTGNLVAKLYAHSGTYGTSSVATGAALATSVNIDVSKLTTSYQEVEIGFDTQYYMTNGTNYVISIEYTGTATDYVHVEGDSTGTHSGNLSTWTGSWAAAAAEDLHFKVYASPRLYGLNGEIFRGITHEINLDGGTGTWSNVETVTWSGGSGQMLAIDNTTATSATKMWIQLLTGVAPTDNQTITGSTSGATNTVNVTVIERTLSQPFIGASTGSAIIGAYGVGIETTDLTASDKVFDLTNTQVTPPNYVTFTVGGLVSGEDRVLVGPESGGTLNVAQFTLNGALTGAAVTSVVVNTTIPSDTPATGTIRILLNSGIYRRVSYTSYTGSTFTIPSTDFSSDNANTSNNTFISYIDKLATSASESFTVVYSTNRALFVRVRDGGTAGDNIPIKTFETAATLGSAGGSVTAIRTSDA